MVPIYVNDEEMRCTSLMVRVKALDSISLSSRRRNTLSKTASTKPPRMIVIDLYVRWEYRLFETYTRIQRGQCTSITRPEQEIKPYK
ncbi:hypothetical protein TMatcc_008490 [Talaromyces marneffei ATCC 18224]